jgi:16S rRNA (cytidine1402-2'-O)-methyltransferase
MPERSAVLCRELTKLHEEVKRGTLQELTSLNLELRGEVTLVIDGADEDEAGPPDPVDLRDEIQRLLAAGTSVRDTVATLLAGSRLTRRQLYAQIQAAKEGLEGD